MGGFVITETVLMNMISKCYRSAVYQPVTAQSEPIFGSLCIHPSGAMSSMLDVLTHPRGTISLLVLFLYQQRICT